MKEEIENERNRPTEKGRDRDPNLRDDSALQPGVSTISSSNTDSSDEELTDTAAEGFRTSGSTSDAKADPRYDETDRD